MTLVLSARVGNPTPAAFTTTVLASDQYDPVAANNSSATGEAIQVANLDLTETVSDTTPTVGETVTYTVNVSNRGPDNATNVRAVVPLPSGLTFFTATPSQGSYDPATGIWTVGSVALGDVPTLTITAEVAVDSAQTTTATISSVDQFVPNTLATSQSVTVTPQAAVAQVLPRFEATLPFAPVIGTLITGSTTVVSASGTGSSIRLRFRFRQRGLRDGSGEPVAGSVAVERLGERDESRPHSPSHAHPSPHATPHAAGPARRSS